MMIWTWTTRPRKLWVGAKHYKIDSNVETTFCCWVVFSQLSSTFPSILLNFTFVLFLVLGPPQSELTPVPAQTAPPGVNPSYWLPPPDALIRQRARSSRGSREHSTSSRQAMAVSGNCNPNEILESSPERARRLLDEAKGDKNMNANGTG